MRYAPGNFCAASALETVEVDNYDVAHIGHTAVPQNLAAMAHQARRIDFVHAQFFAFAGKYQGADLEKSEVGGLAGTLRQADSELNFDGAAESIFPDTHQLIE